MSKTEYSATAVCFCFSGNRWSLTRLPPLSSPPMMRMTMMPRCNRFNSGIIIISSSAPQWCTVCLHLVVVYNTTISSSIPFRRMTSKMKKKQTCQSVSLKRQCQIKQCFLLLILLHMQRALLQLKQLQSFSAEDTPNGRHKHCWHWHTVAASSYIISIRRAPPPPPLQFTSAPFFFPSSLLSSPSSLAGSLQPK